MVTKQLEYDKAALRQTILEEVDIAMRCFQQYVDKGIIKDLKIEVKIIQPDEVLL